MRKIRDVLRLKLEAQLSHERTAAALHISKGVVTKYVTLATAAGLDWNQIQALDDTALHNRLLGTPRRVSGFVQPDYGRIHQELRRKGMTLMLLWEEHGAQHSGQTTHSYSQFCENYRRYAKTLKRSMRQIHRAGEKLFIDYAGPTVELTDGSRAHIFVAALGASSYTYACATPRETMADWLGATAQALRFIGGVPLLIVPDNPKALIANADRYEPRANETVHDFARHYGTSFLPARPYHPQDKGKVESAVQVVERWILMRLRHQKFATVDDVNSAIAPLLEQLNARAFQKLPGSRASAFAQLDAPALKPLPAQTWELAVYKTVRVHIDQHIEFEGHRYSRPPIPGRSSPGGPRHGPHGGVAAPGAACGLPPALCAQGWIYHGARALVCGPPGAHAVDTRAADPLGRRHWRGHRRVGDTPAGNPQTPRTRLPGLSGLVGIGQAVYPATAGSSLRGGAGAGHHQQLACARHPAQRPRPGAAHHHARVDQSAACPCARPWLLPMKPNK